MILRKEERKSLICSDMIHGSIVWSFCVQPKQRSMFNTTVKSLKSDHNLSFYHQIANGGETKQRVSGKGDVWLLKRVLREAKDCWNAKKPVPILMWYDVKESLLNWQGCSKPRCSTTGEHLYHQPHGVSHFCDPFPPCNSQLHLGSTS